MYVYIWALSLLAALLLYLRRVFTHFSRHDVKHLNTIPVVETIFKVMFRKEHFLEEFDQLYEQFPNERFMGRYEIILPVIVIRDLELIKKIYIKDFEYFLDHRGMGDDNSEPLFTRSLFFLRGQEWKDMRSTLSPAFTSSKIRLMVPFIEELGDQMVTTLKETLKENKFTDIDCKDLTTRFANDVIASCAFGLKVNSHVEKSNKFYEMGIAATSFKLRHMLTMMLMSLFPVVTKVFKLSLLSKEVKSFFIDLVLTTMKNREENNVVRHDMIHLLMQAKKGNLTHEDGVDPKDAGFATVQESTLGKRKTNREWSDTDIVAQAVIFFFAGFETISTAMSFALHEVAVHPEVQEKLVQEIREHEEKHRGKLDYNSVQNMKYLDMVVSEVLRLWPPNVVTDRKCNKDSYNLGTPNNETEKEYIVRKGETIFVSIWNLHRDPQLYPDPLKFDPERFSDENKHLINPMAYLPFGAGPRNCIGSRFALLEAKVLLFKILKHFEVSPCEKTCLPARLSKDSFSPRLEGGHWLRFKLRE